MARKKTWLCQKHSREIGHGLPTASPRASQKRPPSRSTATDPSNIRTAVLRTAKVIKSPIFISTGITVNQSHIESLHVINCLQRSTDFPGKKYVTGICMPTVGQGDVQ